MLSFLLIATMTLLLITVQFTVRSYTLRATVSRRVALATTTVLLPNISTDVANAQDEPGDVLLATVKGANEALTSLRESSRRRRIKHSSSSRS